ncbi:uncharacterized protein LOC143219277 [Lasioglossum baleicum]|uniref:uncharacterized protein LOC143219277 n=1 Tax=Lasioglossum baleicum TaxID=434251 RepID=UPI003FCC36EF
MLYLDSGSSCEIIIVYSNCNKPERDSNLFSLLIWLIRYGHYTPLNVMIAESKLMLLSDRSIFLCERYLAQIVSNKGSKIVNTVTKYYHLSKRKNSRFKNIILDICIDRFPELKDKIISDNNYNLYCHDFNTLVTSIPINTTLGSELRDPVDPNPQIKKKSIANVDYVGCSCVCYDLNIRFKKSIDRNVSIFTAECWALCDVMDVTLQHRNRSFAIFTDSLSVLLILNSISFKIRKNPFILEIKKKYVEFSQDNSHSITFFWIPSHIGVYGNEDTDSLAKAATSSNSADIFQVPFTDFTCHLRLKGILNTRSSITEQGTIKGIHYFQNFYNPNQTPWFAQNFDDYIKRGFISTVNRIRANHYNLAASLYRVNIVSDPSCKCNYSSEDLDHVLWQCRLYDSQRIKLACEYIFQFLNDCSLHL